MSTPMDVDGENKEPKVDLPVKIGKIKHEGDVTIRNGKFDGQSITVVESIEDVVEKGLISQYILRYLMDTNKGQKLFDPYVCTLEELILIKTNKMKLDQVECEEEERKVLEKFDFLDANHRPTSDGIDLLRNLLEGLHVLYFKKMIHGDLTPKNIVICVAEGKLIAKLTRIKNRVIKDKDYISFASVMEECFFREGCNTDDIREVEELWNHIHKYGKPSMGLNKADWNKLVKKTEDDFKKDPRSLLKNALFWSPEVSITLISQCRMLIDICTKKCNNKGRVWQFTKAMRAIRTQKKVGGIKENKDIDWKSRLPDFMHGDLDGSQEKEGKYRTMETQELIRYIRNSYWHFEDKKEPFKTTVGTPPDKYFEYFRKLFPDLLLDMHRVLQFYFSDVQFLVGFSYRFEAYL